MANKGGRPKGSKNKKRRGAGFSRAKGQGGGNVTWARNTPKDESRNSSGRPRKEKQKHETVDSMSSNLESIPTASTTVGETQIVDISACAQPRKRYKTNPNNNHVVGLALAEPSQSRTFPHDHAYNLNTNQDNQAVGTQTTHQEQSGEPHFARSS